MLQNGIGSGDAKRYMTNHRLNFGGLWPFFHWSEVEVYNKPCLPPYIIPRSSCTSLSELGRRICGESIFRTAISSLDLLDLLSRPYTYPHHAPLVIEADIPILPPQRPTHHCHLPSKLQARSCPAQKYHKMDVLNKGEDKDAVANRKYIHWQDEGVEKIPPNEAEDMQAVADRINTMQKAQYNSHRHCYSG